MDEVEGRSHEPVERWPPEAVPGEVQAPDGDAPVDEGDVGRPVVPGITVLEGSGEEVEAVGRGEPWKTLGQGEHVGSRAGWPGERGAQIQAEVHEALHDNRVRPAPLLCYPHASRGGTGMPEVLEDGTARRGAARVTALHPPAWGEDRRGGRERSWWR